MKSTDPPIKFEFEHVNRFQVRRLTNFFQRRVDSFRYVFSFCARSLHPIRFLEMSTEEKWMLTAERIAESETAEYLGVIIEDGGITDKKTILRIGKAMSRQRLMKFLGNVS